jgi:hypothetical protein
MDASEQVHARLTVLRLPVTIDFVDTVMGLEGTVSKLKSYTN